MMKKILLLILLISTSFSFGQMAGMDSKGYATDAVTIQFSNETVAELRDRQLYLSGQELINEVPGYWTPVYRLSAEKLKKLHKTAEKNLGKTISDPAKTFRFHVNDAADRDKAILWLQQLQGVERASKLPVPMEATVPDYTADQMYVHTAEPGIHAETVWSTYSNRGEGIKICDVEYAFNPDHTDLPPVTLLGVEVLPEVSGNNGNHGTAVFGEMASLNNGTGTTGIATESDYYFAPVYVDEMYLFENAVAFAASELSEGDIILIEQHMAGPNYQGSGQAGFVPMEWYWPFYDAIQLAVGNGIIVVEAAGNGGENLDDPIYSVENEGHYPFLPGNGSGAILIGAGSAENDPGNSNIKLWFSNYGSCVHLQGNGNNVTTTGYGDLFDVEGFDNEYTASFGGTSSASPIVTGAVALVQSVYLEETGDRLTSDQIRDLLILTGKPQVGSPAYPVSMHIGPLPNLDAALETLIDQLSVGEKTENDLMVYPNPGNGTFVVKHTVTTFNTSEWTISDLAGNHINYTNQLLGENMVAIHLQEAASGIYFLQYKGAEGNMAERIIVAE